MNRLGLFGDCDLDLGSFWPVTLVTLLEVEPGCYDLSSSGGGQLELSVYSSQTGGRDRSASGFCAFSSCLHGVTFPFRFEVSFSG